VRCNGTPGSSRRGSRGMGVVRGCLRPLCVERASRSVGGKARAG
jgi:hypothetical protein